MMNSAIFFSVITTFLFSINTANEVVIKSLLSQDESTVYVDLSLPVDADVSFSLSEDTGKLKHHWENQKLTRGTHQIALPLPMIAQGKYLLLIMVGDKQYEQLVFLTRG